MQVPEAIRTIISNAEGVALLPLTSEYVSLVKRDIDDPELDRHDVDSLWDVIGGLYNDTEGEPDVTILRDLHEALGEWQMTL